MKTVGKYFVALIALPVFVSTLMNAQAVVPSASMVTKRFDDKSLGGEGLLKRAYLSADGEAIVKTFEIEVPQAGDYYIAAWAGETRGKNGPQVLQVWINEQRTTTLSLDSVSSGWQSKRVVNSLNKTTLKYYLSTGVHTVHFACSGPAAPQVDFIRIARETEKAAIPDTKYQLFMNSVRASRLPGAHMGVKRDSTSRLGKTTDDPGIDYVEQLDMSFSYTYYHTFYWASAGSQVTFETKKADPYASDPVMEFFNAEDPINKGSWMNDDGGQGNQSKLTVTIPYSGYYILLLWSYELGTSGTSDLYLNDNLFASDIPLTHAGVRCDHSVTDTLNYYTAFLTGDSRIWIEDQDGFPGKIRAYNDDYSGSGDFSWGYNARVRQPLSMSIRATQLSAYSSGNPTGSCDLYMNCGLANSDIFTSFGNLKRDDAIRSAPATSTYNCHSWAGGITSYSVAPGQQLPWYVYGITSTLQAFDNYYANKNYLGESYPRYSGAMNYTRSGATTGNAAVALWARDCSEYQHSSVRKPGNAHPHGYDWESKPGSLMRIFHPRDALVTDPYGGYGTICNYYRWDGTYSGNFRSVEDAAPVLTLAKSVAAGLSLIETVDLSDLEKAKLARLAQGIPSDVLNEFDARYAAWRKTWEDPSLAKYSNPDMFARSQEYVEFLDFSKSNGSGVWPLLIRNLVQGNEIDFIPIEELTYPKYRYLMDGIAKEFAKARYTSDGVYIVSPPRSFSMRYVKSLLALPDSVFGDYTGSTKDSSATTTLDRHASFGLELNFPNPFNPMTQIQYSLPNEARVSIKIYDMVGRAVVTLLDNELRNAGRHTVRWEGRNELGNPVASGTYFCRLIADGQIRTLKMTFIK